MYAHSRSGRRCSPAFTYTTLVRFDQHGQTEVNQSRGVLVRQSLYLYTESVPPAQTHTPTVHLLYKSVASGFPPLTVFSFQVPGTMICGMPGAPSTRLSTGEASWPLAAGG